MQARYRVLFNTLLAGATGLEEGLINWDSPFCGTRSFGMCFVSDQGLAAIGTMLHIDTHERLDDGQVLVATGRTLCHTLCRILCRTLCRTC